jgi:hypothetical protein
MFIAAGSFFRLSCDSKSHVLAVTRLISPVHATINISCLWHLLLPAGHHQSNFFVAGNLWIDFADDPAVVNHQQPIG